MGKIKEKRWTTFNVFRKMYTITPETIRKLIRNGYIEKDEDYKIIPGLHQNINLVNINSTDKIIELVRIHCNRNYRREYW